MFLGFFKQSRGYVLDMFSFYNRLVKKKSGGLWMFLGFHDNFRLPVLIIYECSRNGWDLHQTNVFQNLLFVMLYFDPICYYNYWSWYQRGGGLEVKMRFYGPDGFLRCTVLTQICTLCTEYGTKWDLLRVFLLQKYELLPNHHWNPHLDSVDVCVCF